MPTAIGSVRAATSGASPFGTGTARDSSTTSCSAYAPGAAAERPIAWTSLPRRSSGRATTGVPGGELLRQPGP